jgi:membrane-associated protein
MDLLRSVLDFVFHLDTHLYDLATAYGLWIYLLLFVVIFCETGLVVTPFLPGDSLLFASGAIAATGALSAHGMVVCLVAAAILGDTLNYWIGWYVGPKVFHKNKSMFFNPEHLRRTHNFYEKHGGKTIIIARFIPIIRTFAPFVAGIGQMRYGRFLSFNVWGAILWVPSFVYAGYFFGNIPVVKKNFTLVILMIIILSVLPAVFEFIRHRRQARFVKVV